MAGKRRRANGTWEYVFKRKGVLEAPVYFTFDSEEEGDGYSERAEALLDKGIVPQEMLPEAVTTFGGLIGLYGASVRIAHSERLLLPVLTSLVGSVKTSSLTYNWVERWVGELHAAGKAPSTITKRISGLARVVDWAMRKEFVSLTANPLRLLPKGYGSKGFDRNKGWEGERSRRLEDGEEEQILAVVTGHDRLLFEMALETAMRMSEMFMLRTEDVDLDKRTIFLHRTKPGRRRQVPLSTVILKRLEAERLHEREFVFPEWWQGGGQEEQDTVSNKLSHRFRAVFKKAGVAGLHFHDLRHEATSRLYERTKMSDLEIASITGHKGFKMLQRYANLRGSTLSEKLW